MQSFVYNRDRRVYLFHFCVRFFISHYSIPCNNGGITLAW